MNNTSHKNKLSTLLLGAAVAGLVSGAAVSQSFAHGAERGRQMGEQKKDEAKKKKKGDDKESCSGKNGCSGKDGCSGKEKGHDKESCSGKNGCSGKK